MSNLGRALAFNLIAFSLAVFPITMMLALLGGTQFETPLLLTLIAGTLSTTVVAVVTTRAFSTIPDLTEDSVREFASVAYIFVNASGTLAIIISHLVQTFETGRKSFDIQSRDAVSLILDQFSLLPKDAFALYLIINSLCASVALLLIYWGARIISDRGSDNPSRLAFLSILSVLLLVVGLVVGTSWAPAPISTGTIETALSVAIEVIGAGILLFAAFGFAALQLFAVRQLAVLFSVGAFRIGAKYTSTEYRRLAIATVWQIMRGVFIGAIVSVAIWVFGFSVALSVSEVPEFPDGDARRLAQAVVLAIYKGMQVAGALVAAALSASIILLSLKPTLKASAQIFALIRILMSYFWRIATNAASFVVRTSIRLVRRVPKATSGKSSSDNDSVTGEANEFLGSGAVAQVGRLPKFDFENFGAAVVGLFVMGLLYAAYLEFISQFGESERAVAARGEGELPFTPAPPGFEFARPQPVSLCQALPGGFDWVLSSSRSLEIDLDSCALSESVRTASDGVLIVVSVASLGNDQARELQLAMQRGQEISQWASFQTPAEMPIYVLNLGMSRRAESFSLGWRLFGRVTGERPVLALLIRPYPEGTEVPVEAILSELSENLSLESVTSNFTNCELFRFDNLVDPQSQLVPVPQFDCGRS